MYKGKEKETICNGRLFLCPDNCLCRDYAPRYPFRSNCQVKAILHGRNEQRKRRGTDVSRRGRRKYQLDLYIWCEKFPQEVISSVNYSGFG